MATTCSTCHEKHYAKGFCRKHYYAQPEWKARLAARYQSKQDEKKAAARLNYQANKDRAAVCRKAWAAANPQKMQQARKDWVAANPERAREAMRAGGRRYTQAHPEQRRIANANRHAKKRMAIPAWADTGRISEVYRRAAALGFEVDHVVPLCSPLVCGLHVWENLQVLDRPLNLSKGNRHWPDMPEEMPCV